MIERICKNCRHYRTVEGIDRNTGLKVVDGYCHASRNFAKRAETDTCKRYHFKLGLEL